jgi:hypothetical protein
MGVSSVFDEWRLRSILGGGFVVEKPELPRAPAGYTNADVF